MKEINKAQRDRKICHIHELEKSVLSKRVYYRKQYTNSMQMSWFPGDSSGFSTESTASQETSQKARLGLVGLQRYDLIFFLFIVFTKPNHALFTVSYFFYHFPVTPVFSSV